MDSNTGKEFCATICGGSIYNATTVITAAHCCVGAVADGSSWNLYNIVAGELDVLTNSGFEQRRKIKDHLIHPDYDENTLQNDICLLTMDSPFEFNDQVKAIPLDTVGPSTGKNCQVSGWGTLQVSKILQTSSSMF